MQTLYIYQLIIIIPPFGEGTRRNKKQSARGGVFTHSYKTAYTKEWNFYWLAGVEQRCLSLFRGWVLMPDVPLPESGYTVTVWGSGVKIKAPVNNLYSSSLRKRTSCNWASTSLDFTCVSFSVPTGAFTAASICRASIVSLHAALCKSFIHGSLFRCPIFSRCTFPSSSSLNTTVFINLSPSWL